MSTDAETTPADYLAGALALLGAGAFAVGRRRRESGETDVESRSVDVASRSLDEHGDELVLSLDADGVWR